MIREKEATSDVLRSLGDEAEGDRRGNLKEEKRDWSGKKRRRVSTASVSDRLNLITDN